MGHERRRRAVVFFLEAWSAWPSDAPEYVWKLDEFEPREFAQSSRAELTHIKPSGLLVQKRGPLHVADADMASAMCPFLPSSLPGLLNPFQSPREKQAFPL